MKKIGLLLALCLTFTAVPTFAEEADTASKTEAVESTQETTSEAGQEEAGADAYNLWLTDPELMFRINRSDLECFSGAEGKIYVFGHTSPDADTVCTSIAYARLLQKLGYDAEAVTLQTVDRETEFILKETGVEMPQILEDASGKNVVLIDHSDYGQSAPGLEDANILSIIDHHTAGTVTTGNQITYDERPFGSAATIVWIRYMNYNVPIDAQTAALMLCALMSDTTNLTAQITEADCEAFKALKEISGVEDTDGVYQEMYKAKISYSGMTDEEIYNSDLKSYESNGTTFLIGVVNAYDQAQAEDLAERMKKIMPAQAKAQGADMAFSQISIFHDDLSYVYLVPSDEKAAALIEQAFGDTGTFDGTSYVFNPGFSRRQVLVPKLTDALEQNPRE